MLQVFQDFDKKFNGKIAPFHLKNELIKYSEHLVSLAKEKCGFDPKKALHSSDSLVVNITSLDLKELFEQVDHLLDDIR